MQSEANIFRNDSSNHWKYNVVDMLHEVKCIDTGIYPKRGGGALSWICLCRYIIVNYGYKAYINIRTGEKFTRVLVSPVISYGVYVKTFTLLTL